VRIRAGRRNRVVWSSAAVPASRSGYPARTQPARARRVRWWLRIWMLLAVIGVMRLAQAVRARRRDALLVAAIVLTVLSLALENELIFFCGMLFGMIACQWPWDEGVGG
jgi:hypothetical protein